MQSAAEKDRLGDFTTNARVLVLALLAVVIGVISAGVAYALVWLIAVITNLSFYFRFSSAFVSPDRTPLGYWMVLVPIVGGLIIGFMARYGSERIRGHGIPEALEAILIDRSRMDAKVAILKPISSAVSIGTGGPFGAEGPIIMTGGAFGSLFAQAFRLSAVERKTLLVAGAAGGMAAIFASPVAAVMLAVELLLFEWKPRSFIPVACAAAVAGALRVPLLGAGPIFPVDSHVFLDGKDLVLAALFGVIAGFGSGALTGLVYGFEDLFMKLPIHWMWWPTIGGLAVGLGGLLDPRALGVGYDTIHDLLKGELIGQALVALLLVKAAIWSIALGSGTSGGVLAPLLIMGGALGGLEAQVLNLSDPGLWAMISMAAIMGGTMRSPFTAVVFLLELTHDVNVVPGLLIACTAAHGVTVLLLRRSILTEKVARRGHHVMREYVVSALQRLRVGEVMAVDFVTIPATMTVGELAERLARPDAALDHHPAWPVVDEDDQLVGIVTRGDVFRTIAQPEGKSRTVLEAGSDALLVTYPDELLEDAVVRMIRNDVGRLPVVDRQNDRRVVGYLGRTGVLRALGRRLREEHVLEAGWLSVRLRFLRSRVRHTFRRGGGDGRGLGAEAVGVRSRAEKEAGPRGDRPGRSRG